MFNHKQFSYSGRAFSADASELGLKHSMPYKIAIDSGHVQKEFIGASFNDDMWTYTCIDPNCRVRYVYIYNK